MKNILLEACVETYEQAIRAEQRGARRIELCAHLEHGGLTPAPDLVRKLLRELAIPIKVMIRPRAGNFIYTSEEIEQMAGEILLFKKMGVQEIVLGMLTANGSVDLEQLQQLADTAAPMAITFHKAIDETQDPLAELERMKNMPSNVQYILTSGQQPTAQQGQAMLKKMVKQFSDRFTIIAAGRVTDENLSELHRLIGAREYHGRKIVGDLEVES
jgi:copper homeostasis protein